VSDPAVSVSFEFAVGFGGDRIMGASGWEYVALYEGGVEQSLRALQQKVFDEEFAHGRNPDYFGVPVQTYGSLEELWADEEFMGECGTHTVIDVYRLIAADAKLGRHEHYNTIGPLTDERLEHYFGTTTPSLAQYQAAMDRDHQLVYTHPRTERILTDEAELRWTGRYVVVYTDGQPTHLGVFGRSGD
jgi:hypothetical protein